MYKRLLLTNSNSSQLLKNTLQPRIESKNSEKREIFWLGTPEDTCIVLTLPGCKFSRVGSKKKRKVIGHLCRVFLVCYHHHNIVWQFFV